MPKDDGSTYAGAPRPGQRPGASDAARTLRPTPQRERQIPLGERRYAWVSQRPLHVLVFLLPLIVAYEVGSVLYLYDPEQGVFETIRAHEQLMRVLGAFGSSAVFLPGILLVVVLMVWHLLSRDPWKLRPSALGGMLLESALWALPLLVLGQMVQRVSGESLSAASAAAALAQNGQIIEDAPTLAKLTLAIGAGLYEELMFRLFGIAAIHFILVDLLRMKTRPGMVIAVVISAVAFALYHDAAFLSGWGGLDLQRAAFLTIAGVYLGGVFVFRGFGIVVAAHAIYDIVVFTAS